MQIERSMISGFLSVSLLSLWLCCGAYGQSAGLPEFEAAAVRVNNSDAPQSGAYDPGGQFTLRGVTMRMLVGIAWKETRTLADLTALEIAVAPSVAQFNTNNYLKGGPAWLDSDRFDVTAKAPTGTPTDTVRLMVQKLLADRFHLFVHREEKVVKIYAMVTAKGGFKLKQSDGGTPVCTPSIGNDNVYHRECHNITMQRLAEQLPNFAPRFFEGRPVVDATGLKGGWDFRLDWTPLSGGLAGLGAGPNQEFDTGTTIFSTMEKNLGIKLEKREQSTPIIVIDRVDRTPTEN
jgi:uncharacterized protein (TIGR03435 family)